MPRTRRGNLGHEGGAGEPHQAKDSKAIIFDEILATFRVMAERDERERPFDMAVPLAIGDYRYDVSAPPLPRRLSTPLPLCRGGPSVRRLPAWGSGFRTRRSRRSTILPITLLTMQLIASSVSNQTDEQWDE